MLDPNTIDAVVFDIGGVFLVPHPDPIRRVLQTIDIHVADDADLFRKAHYHGVRGMTDAVVAKGVAPDERAVAIWSAYDNSYFKALGVPHESLDAAARARSCHRGSGDSSVWTLRLPNNIDAFHSLALGHRPLAIVSNNDGSAASEMRNHGVCQLGPGPLPSVVALVDSTVIGIAKPDPHIFDPVKTALAHVAAQRMLYVGDTVHADVGGARAADMQVVQLDPFELHSDHDHPTLPDLPALADLLL